MKLGLAIQAARAQGRNKIARAQWYDNMYVVLCTQHRIGSSPIVVVDIDSDADEPPGWRGYMTLLRTDPQKRVLPAKDLEPGLRRPRQEVVHFEIPDWRPSIEDLFATDWMLVSR